MSQSQERAARRPVPYRPISLRTDASNFLEIRQGAKNPCLNLRSRSGCGNAVPVATLLMPKTMLRPQDHVWLDYV
jgi:hypothetical protein